MIKTLMLMAALFVPNPNADIHLSTPRTVVESVDAGKPNAGPSYLDTEAKAQFRGQVELVRAQAEEHYKGAATVTVDAVTFSEDGRLASATLSEFPKGSTIPRVKVTILAMLDGDHYKSVALLLGPGKP